MYLCRKNQLKIGVGDFKAHIAFFQRTCDIFHQNVFWEIQKNNSSRLRTYGIIKTQIGCEDYLKPD